MKNSWVILSFIALFTLSFMTIIMTYLVRKGLPLVFVLLVIFFAVTLFYGGQMLLTDVKVGKVSAFFWLLLLAAAACSAIANLALVRANVLSPNPGLVATILGLQAGVTAILAMWFLRNHLNLMQVVGIIVGTVAVIIIALGSRTGATATKGNTVTTGSTATKLVAK